MMHVCFVRDPFGVCVERLSTSLTRKPQHNWGRQWGRSGATWIFWDSSFKTPPKELLLHLGCEGEHSLTLDVHGFGALEEPLPPLGRGPNEAGKFLWTFWDGSSNRLQPTNVTRDEMEPTAFVLGGKFDQSKQVIRSGNIETPKVTQSGKRLENFSGW